MCLRLAGVCFGRGCVQRAVEGAVSLTGRLPHTNMFPWGEGNVLEKSFHEQMWKMRHKIPPHNT